MIKPIDTYQMISLSKETEFKETAFLIFTSKRLTDDFAKPLLEEITQIDGINNIRPAGLYSFIISLAPNFPEEAILNELREILLRNHSNLLVPKGQGEQIKLNMKDFRKK